MRLSNGRKGFKIGLAVLIQYRRVTSNQPAIHQPPSHVAVVSTRYAYLCRAVKRFSMWRPAAILNLQNFDLSPRDLSRKRITHSRTKYHKKLSSCWQTRATRLEVNQRLPNSSIPYVRYSFLLCNSKFVFVLFLRYSTSKKFWPWNRSQRSLKVIESGTIL